MCLAQGPQHSDTSEARTHGPSVLSQALYHLATVLPLKNSKTIWILVRPLWLFSQTPCIHLGIPRGGGSKLITFFIAFFTAKYCMHWSRGGGTRGPDPLKKTSYIRDSIGNKQLDPPPPRKSWTPPPGKNVGAPLEPRKIIIFFEINHWHSVK